MLVYRIHEAHGRYVPEYIVNRVAPGDLEAALTSAMHYLGYVHPTVDYEHEHLVRCYEGSCPETSKILLEAEPYLTEADE